jgi:hypothetical protein
MNTPEAGEIALWGASCFYSLSDTLQSMRMRRSGRLASVI